MSRLPTTEIGAHRAKMMKKYKLTMDEIVQYTHQSRQNICSITQYRYRTLEQNKKWFEVICAGVAHVKATRGRK